MEISVQNSKEELNLPYRVIHSEKLFGQEKMIYIQHEGAVYRLVITRNGKLILNK